MSTFKEFLYSENRVRFKLKYSIITWCTSILLASELTFTFTLIIWSILLKVDAIAMSNINSINDTITIRDPLTNIVKWNKKLITYRISEYSQQHRLSPSFIDQEISRAFSIWEEYTDLQFFQSSDYDVDIEIKFTNGSHGDSTPFLDGNAETLGHAFAPGEGIGGDIHFNDNYTGWDEGTTLLHTATHEIGHAIGMMHSYNRKSIMSPYQGDASQLVFLANDDIYKVQKLYGPKQRTTTPATTATVTDADTNVPTFFSSTENIITTAKTERYSTTKLPNTIPTTTTELDKTTTTSTTEFATIATSTESKILNAITTTELVKSLSTSEFSAESTTKNPSEEINHSSSSAPVTLVPKVISSNSNSITESIYSAEPEEERIYYSDENEIEEEEFFRAVADDEDEDQHEGSGQNSPLQLHDDDENDIDSGSVYFSQEISKKDKDILMQQINISHINNLDLIFIQDNDTGRDGGTEVNEKSIKVLFNNNNNNCAGSGTNLLICFNEIRLIIVCYVLAVLF